MFRLLLITVALLGCSRATDQDKTKTLQDQAPPRVILVPDGVSIPVEVDGAARPPITSEMLRAAKPDFANDERRAWLVATLVADAAPVGAVVEATAPTGTSVKIIHPTTDGFEPVVILTRRGDLLVSAIDPKDPFPRYHGQGGRLHRPGDSAPRVGPIAKLSVTRPTKP